MSGKDVVAAFGFCAAGIVLWGWYYDRHPDLGGKPAYQMLKDVHERVELNTEAVDDSPVYKPALGLADVAVRVVELGGDVTRIEDIEAGVVCWHVEVADKITEWTPRVVRSAESDTFGDLVARLEHVQDGWAYLVPIPGYRERLEATKDDIVIGGEVFGETRAVKLWLTMPPPAKVSEHVGPIDQVLPKAAGVRPTQCRQEGWQARRR